MITLPRHIARIGLVLALMAAAGCEPKAMTAVRLNRTAQLYVDRGRCPDAQEVLLKSFEADHDNPTGHYLMGHCYEADGLIERALYEYRLAVRFDPSGRDYQLALITALERNGRSAEADEALHIFLKYRQGPVRHFLDIAKEFQQRDMMRLRFMTLEYAAKVHPEEPRILIEMADYYFGKGEEMVGIDHLVQAFKLDPTYPGLSRQLGEHGMRVEIPEATLPPMDEQVEEEETEWE